MKTVTRIFFLVLFCVDVALASWHHNIRMIWIFGVCFIFSVLYGEITRRD